MLFQFLRGMFGLESGALLVGAICVTAAFFSLRALEETNLYTKQNLMVKTV